MSAWTARDVGFYAALLIAAIIPNGVWRWVTVFAAARLADDSPFFLWIRHVASCLVAGVVAQLLIAPSGALATVSPSLRFGALAFAAAIWLLGGRRVFVAWVAGVAALIVGASLT